MLSEQDIRRIGIEMGHVIEDNLNPRFDAIEQRLDGVERRLTAVEQRLTGVEATTVTKDYLDDKLADLRSEFHVHLHRPEMRAI